VLSNLVVVVIFMLWGPTTKYFVYFIFYIIKVVLDCKIIYILLTVEASNNVHDCNCPDGNSFLFCQ
jgi:hypothetical protein